MVLSETTLLESCVLGATQNQSEILNALVWACCPKHKHRGHKAVSCAVASAVCLIHKWSESRFGAIKRFSIPSGINTKRADNIKDFSRCHGNLQEEGDMTNLYFLGQNIIYRRVDAHAFIGQFSSTAQAAGTVAPLL